jgi:hypothetical protein
LSASLLRCFRWSPQRFSVGRLAAQHIWLVNPALLIAPMVLLVLNGLRYKTVFLAVRGEQYLPARTAPPPARAATGDGSG